MTKTENGGFKGTLATMNLKKNISILPNAAKETDAQPDFRVYTEDHVEIGGGPIYRKHGRHVRYHIDDLSAWSNLRKMDSTSDVRTSDAR